MDGAALTLSGSEFQIVGAATINALSPHFNFVFGT
jgi:hypothetical protein